MAPISFFWPPKGSRSRVIIPPEGTRFVTGVAYQYKEIFPKELEAHIEFDDYQRVISDINDILKTFWPCLCSMLIGYLLCPVTFGLSLLIPNICIRDAETEINRIIRSANQNVFGPKKMFMEFRKGCFTSWIQINLLDYATSEHKEFESKECIEEYDRV